MSEKNPPHQEWVYVPSELSLEERLTKYPLASGQEYCFVDDQNAFNVVPDSHFKKNYLEGMEPETLNPLGENTLVF